MSEKLSLEVASREVTGKKVNALRREGLIPGVIYGPTRQESVSIQVEWAVLRPVLSQAGGTSLIDLKLGGQSISVLVRSVQRHPVRRDVLHIDFYAVDVNAPIRTRLPVVIHHQEAAAKRLGARIFQSLNVIEIECLPSDIPAEIAVDLSVVKRAGQNVTVGDLPALKGVTYLADDEVLVARTVSLSALVEEEAEETEMGETSLEPEVIRKGKALDEKEEF
jgi:large subunit ribosomal protein L25